MPQPYIERRYTPRNPDLTLRRRHGRLRPIAFGQTFLPFPLHEHPLERRRAHGDDFDVASALELHLDSFPTREGMMVLLRAWLNSAEDNALTTAGYTRAVRRALDAMEQCDSPAEALQVLRGVRMSNP